MAETAVIDSPVTPAATAPPVTTGTPTMIAPATTASSVEPGTAASTASTTTHGTDLSAAMAAPAPVTYQLVKPDKPVIDDTDVAAITQMATDRGWTNDQAQAAMNELDASLKAQAQAFKTELDAHPEIGGTKYQVAQEHAMRALDRFLPAGSPEGDAFRTAMNKSGYGNYAPLMLFMSRIGKAMAEDRPFGAGSQPATQAPPVRLSDEEVFYGRTTSKPKPT